MSDPKEIWLSPECHEMGEGRQWCEDDVWDACGEPGCDCTSVRYVLAADHDMLGVRLHGASIAFTIAERRVAELTALCAELYQVLGVLDAPANVLDKVSAAANGESIPDIELLPFFLAGQQQQGDHIPDVTKMVDSEECISDEGKCGLGGYCEPCPAKAEQAAAADEQAENAKEAAEILRNMIDTITYHGNYSVESTLNFLNQALGSVNAAISTTARSLCRMDG